MINVQVNRIVVRLLYIARTKGFEPFNTFDDLVVYTRDTHDVSDVVAKVAASTACAKSDTPLVKPIEPRSCGSCHMLTGNYDGDRYNAENLKCVYENGPEFEYGSVVKWLKLCEYYVRRVD